MRSISLLLLAPAVALSAACTDDPSDAPSDDVGSTSQSILNADDQTAPLYSISVVIETDNTANLSVPVNKDQYSTTYGPYDEVRVGLAGYLSTNGTSQPSLVGTPVICNIGDPVHRPPYFDPQDLVLTKPGGIYSTCQGTPFDASYQGPLALPDAMPVKLADTLYLYTRLEVENSGAVMGNPSDPNAGVAGGLLGIGGFWTSVGTVLALVPPLSAAGGAFTAAGGHITAVGQLAQSPQHPAELVCLVTDTLIPGFSATDTPNDQLSSLLRIPLQGSELWEQTKNGDAVVEYDLDFGQYAQTKLCARPKTRMFVRVRRVVSENTAGDPPKTRGGIVTAMSPDAMDAYTVDGNKNVRHDQWNGKGWPASSEYLPDTRTTTGCGPYGCYGFTTKVFPAWAHIAGVAKAPGEQDIYGISAQGKLVNNWRNVGWDSNHWHTWVDHSGAYFPPGAPVAVITRNPGHIDVFAVATDGSIMTNSWDASAGWGADAVRITAPNMIKPYNGVNGGGVAAVSTGLASPYDGVTVFAGGVNYELVQVSWTLFGGWQVWDNAGVPTPDVWVTPGSSFAVATRNQYRTDLVFIDAYGQPRAEWWDNGWHTQQLAPQTGFTAPKGGEVALVTRKTDVTGDPFLDNDRMDFFAIGSDGAVMHTNWIAGQNLGQWFWANAEKLPGVVGGPGGPIGAVSPEAGSIQVAVRRGTDGGLAHAWFTKTNGGYNQWSAQP